MTENDTDERPKFAQRTITAHFDDEVGEGMYVTIKNPAMLPPKKLSPSKDLSKVKDPKQLERLSNEWLASFVTEWQMIDATDDNWDDPALLGAPDDDTISRCPAVATSWIVRQIRECTDPQ